MKTSRLAHSYLITGPSQVGKATLAVQLAAAVNCVGPDPPCNQCLQCTRIENGQHTDISMLMVNEELGHKSIGIDQVQEALRQCHLKPFEGKYRVVIIESADHLSLEASSSLLKILEEPPDQLLLILTTANPQSVISTIWSRCQRLRLRIVPENVISTALETRWGMQTKKSQELAKLSKGLPGRAIEAANNPSVFDVKKQHVVQLITLMTSNLEKRLESAEELSKSFSQKRSYIQDVLETWALFWHDVLMIKFGTGQDTPEWSVVPNQFDPDSITEHQIAVNIKKIISTKEMLDGNVNPRLALESLLIALPDIPSAAQSRMPGKA